MQIATTIFFVGWVLFYVMRRAASSLYLAAIEQKSREDADSFLNGVVGFRVLSWLCFFGLLSLAAWRIAGRL